MRQLLCLIAFVLVICFSCKKDSTQNNLEGVWVWTIQYAGNPAYNLTPKSTGIQETLAFNNNSYSLVQNSAVTNSGMYKLSTAKNTSGGNILSILYTNERVADSAAYYTLNNNNDSLFFSHDLIGTIGSGSRHYGRK